MGSRISEKPEKLFEVFLEIGKPEGGKDDPFIIHKFPAEYDDKETLAMTPKFAYPCPTDASNVDHFTFVLTDIDGMFRFGYCRHATGHQTCLCILSPLPWCEVFFKMLDLLAEITNRSEQNNVNDFLQVTYAHEIPLPKIPVTIVANEDMFSFTSPDPSVLPSIPNSRNLTEYYNAVDIPNMMKIFACMVQERRIYMTSKKLSRLTACIHAAEALLYPMHWQHLFIPVLPSHLIDYISAPMPYLIGVHSNLVEKLKINRVDVADAVVVDLDMNTVTSEYDDLECMPEEVSNFLKKNLKADVVKNSMLKDGDAISKAFLHTLVRTIGGYRAGLKIKTGEPITFDPEMFVHSRSSQTMQNYLEGMLALQIFQQFIYGRLEILNSGGGFGDQFEQLATMYADKLISQSSYKEWLKNVKKGGRKGREVLNVLKVKVKHTSKKAVADLRNKITNITTDDDKRSTFHASGGIVHSRNVKHSSVIVQNSSRPPRPPLSSSLKESTGGQRVSTADSQDDSQIRLSYHKVNVSLMADEDIQAIMMRSASAEALPKYGQGSISSSSSSSSGMLDDMDLANIPFSNLQSSGEEEDVSPVQEGNNVAVTSPPLSSQVKPTPVATGGDRLITNKARSNAQPPARPPPPVSVAIPSPVAPPRARKSGNESPAASPNVEKRILPPPKVQSGTKHRDNNKETSKTVQDAPLIRLESSESETTDSDIFDPLGKPKSAAKTQQQFEKGVATKTDNFIAVDDDGQEVQMREFERNVSSRSSLTRSQAFRRESQKDRVRKGHAQDDRDCDDTEATTSNKDLDGLIFDHLTDLSSITLDSSPSSVHKPPSGLNVQQGRSRTSSDLMKYEWSLASLAPSPRVYLPVGANQGVGIGPKSNSLSPRTSLEQQRAGMVRQATLPANASYMQQQLMRGTLRSQASVGGMPASLSRQSAVAQHPTGLVGHQPKQGPSPSVSSQPGASGSTFTNFSPNYNPTLAAQPPRPAMSSNFRASVTPESKTGVGQSSSSSSSSFGSNSRSGPASSSATNRPVRSPFFNLQGGNPIHTNRNTVGPSSFAPTLLASSRSSSYATSSAAPAHIGNTGGPSKSKQADPFGDLVNLGFGVDKTPPPQQQQEKRPPSSNWETF